MAKIKFKKPIVKGDNVKYTGSGFIGFDPENPFMEFIEWSGLADAYVLYNGNKMLVRKYEIEAA